MTASLDLRDRTTLEPPAIAGVVCPACGGHNPSDSIFCANPACHKALGDFRYVLEELRAETRWHHRVADSVANFVGHPAYVLVHLFWFAVWVAVNTGLVMVVRRFDEYPFGLLGILLSCEAILVTGFVLISQNRQNAHANRRAELDYEVNVRTYREIHEVRRLLEALDTRVSRLERHPAP